MTYNQSDSVVGRALSNAAEYRQGMLQLSYSIASLDLFYQQLDKKNQKKNPTNTNIWKKADYLPWKSDYYAYIEVSK